MTTEEYGLDDEMPAEIADDGDDEVPVVDDDDGDVE
jgi:hypothetical protein